MAYTGEQFVKIKGLKLGDLIEVSYENELFGPITTIVGVFLYTISADIVLVDVDGRLRYLFTPFVNDIALRSAFLETECQ